MKQYKIGEVFLDTDNFPKPKKLKCVKFNQTCDACIYGFNHCGTMIPFKRPCENGQIMFIETNEPLTTE